MKKDINISEKSIKKLIHQSPIIIVVLIIILIINLLNSNVSTKLGFVSKNQFSIILIVFIILNIFCLIAFLILKYKDKLISSYKYLYKIFDYTEFITFVFSILLFIFIYLASPTTVSGASMNNTLASDDKIFVYTMFYKPKVDDIVIIDVNEHYTTLSESYYVKRVVAKEGDKVFYDLTNLSYGSLYVNDTLVEEYITYSEYLTLLTDKYTNTCYIDDSDAIQTVPIGYSIVLGDNRQNSKDSRAIGLIHNSDIIGKAYFRYYSSSLGIGIINKNIKY